MQFAIKQAQSARATDDSANDWLADDGFVQHEITAHPTSPGREDTVSSGMECSDHIDGEELDGEGLSDDDEMPSLSYEEEPHPVQQSTPTTIASTSP